MLRTLVSIGAIQVITMLVMLVRAKTLAVTQGPEFVGVIGVIDKLVAVIVQTTSLSLPFAALKFLPEVWEKSPASYASLYRTMRNVATGIALMAACLALAVTVARPELWGRELLPYRVPLAMAMLGIPVVGLVPLLQNALAGRLEQHRAMAVSFFNAVILALAVAGAWWGGMTGYYAAYLVGGICLIVGAGKMVTSGLPAAVPQSRKGPFGLDAGIWRFGGYLLILTFLSPYAALFVQYGLMGSHGVQAAGWMQAAMGVGLSVRAVLGSAHPVFLTPYVNRGGTPADRMRWANDFHLLFCLLAGIAVPPLLFFPGLAIRLLYADSFAPAAAFLVIFVGAEVLSLIAGTYQALVIALDRMRVHVINNLIAQILVVALAAWLVRPLGILGAGLAGLAAPAWLLLVTLVFLARGYGLRLPPCAVIRGAWLLLGIAASGLVGVATRDAPGRLLLIKAGVYALIVFGFWVTLTAEERGKARALIVRFRGTW